MKTLLTIAISLILSQTINFFGQNDKDGSYDHELIQRFNRSYIYDFEETSFNLYQFPLAAESGNKITSLKEVEGKIYKAFYSLPTDAGSTYEIYSNYLNALKAKGAEILFSCKNNQDCGKYFWDQISSNYLMSAYYGEDLAYLAAKFSHNGKTYYITITAGYGLSEQGYEVHVIETKEMNQQITLEGIEKAMEEKGKILLYGILFETGSAKLKESSTAELELIAKYLKKNSSKKVYIVGHTDNTGTLDNNLTLSDKRAQSVVNYLTDKHKIDNSRLTPDGVGPLCPVSTNKTKEGQQKNRRVEVVLNEN